MQNIIIIGSGDQAKVIFNELIENKKIKILGFLDSKKREKSIILTYEKKRYKVLNQDLYLKKKIKFIIGIGHNFLREEIYQNLLKIKKNINFFSFISKNAIINKNVKIGKGSVVMPGCVINSNTIIGNHCIINTRSVIDHDNYFSDFSSCGPGVISGGNVYIAERSHIGIGTVIKNGIKIKKDTIIGGKSYINKNCTSLHIYYGNPAKKIKKRKINQKYL
jgi:sugar O-acyltransferase (sialic acid O-acetyltransferase NeuD family)